QSPVEVPAELRVLRRPVVGYVGGLHQYVDQDLLVTLAERMPDVDFALVGPAQTDLSKLERMDNIHLLGVRPHDDLPRYIKGFGVGIVPYRLTDYTAHVYPSKLNEYLAMGVPVVATDLQEIRRYNAELGDVVTIAADAAAFESGIRRALEPRSRADVERRIAAAATNGWEARIADMQRLVAGRLAERPRTGVGWESALRRLYHSARRRLSTALLVAASIYVVLFQSPFLWYVAAPLEAAASPRPADAIVVFAGGVGESGKPGAGYQERVKTAVDLYRARMAPSIIISSGYAFVFDEARVMKDLAVSLGVSPAAILLETNARNTHENVRRVADMLRPRAWRSILLVSSPYHMRRALLTWRKVAPEVDVIASPVPTSQFYAHERGASLEQITGILQEYAAILYYWWKGWAAVSLPPTGT
ncbi:MAG: ElyC/SanA/YdcF family protein, partial [Candidatus Binatia bacterium]